MDPGVESAATHDVASTLLSSKQKPSNLNTKQKMALKSLKKKSKDLKIVAADKGNATVVMTNAQYLLLMLPSADEDNDDVIESFWLYIFSVFPSFVYYYLNYTLYRVGTLIANNYNLTITQ